MCFETNLISHTQSFKEIGDIVQNGLEDLRETASYKLNAITVNVVATSA